MSGDRDHHPDRDRQEAEVADDRQVGEPVREADDLFAVGDDAGDAARDRHHRERRDEGRHAQARHHQAGHQAADAGDDQRDEDRDDERPVPVVAEIAHHHAGQREDRADRKVDAADEDHERHADGHDAEHRDLVHHVQEVAQGQERVGRQRQKDAEQDQADQRTGRAAHECDERRRSAIPSRRPLVAIGLFPASRQGLGHGSNRLLFSKSPDRATARPRASTPRARGADPPPRAKA